MKGLQRFILVGAAGLIAALQVQAATVSLQEFAFNIDGAVTNGAAPGGVNLAGFDKSTGLGSISVTLSGVGSHYVALFLDHEIDEADNTFFNEFGSTSGAAGAGQSWEIDEPGYVFGDIYDNFKLKKLDGTNGVPAGSEDDVSLALAWDFNLAAGETATLSFLVSETAPGGFYLTQVDPSSDAAIFVNGTLRIGGGGTAPEPASLGLVGLGLLAAWGARRKAAAA